MKRHWFQLSQPAPDTAHLNIHGPIGRSTGEDAVDAKALLEQLQALASPITTIVVRLNSGGGDPFEAQAIAGEFRRQRTAHGRAVLVEVDALAASAAVLPLCEASTVRMAPEALLMVHEPTAGTIGRAADMRAAAKALEDLTTAIVSTFARRTKRPEQEIRDLIATGDVWFTASEALAFGWCDEVTPAPTEAAPVEDPSTPTPAEACLELPRGGRLTVPDRFKALRPFRPMNHARAQQRPTATPAAATDVIALCRDGRCLAEAEGLIARGATLEQVRAHVAWHGVAADTEAARQRAIVAACQLANVSDLAESYITAKMPLAQVRAQLLIITAKLDNVEIDGFLYDGVRADSRRPARLSVGEVYEARNKRGEK